MAKRGGVTESRPSFLDGASQEKANLRSFVIRHSSFVIPSPGSERQPAGRARGAKPPHAPWTRIEELSLGEKAASRAMRLRGVQLPVTVLRHRPQNVDGSAVDVYSVTNKVSLSGADLPALYQ